MKPLVACPTRDEYIQLQTGAGLTDEQITRLSSHLEKCERCAAVIESLPGGNDPNLILLRQKSSATDAAAHQLMDELCRLAPLASPAASSAGNADAGQPTENSLGLLGQEAFAAPAVPGYEILGLLGRGGMGMVYQAKQLSLNRLVALKIIRPEAGHGSASVARFRAEAEAVALFQHPHIVQIYEIGEHGGQPYFSLEFVPGGTLAQQINSTPQPSLAGAHTVVALARAVQAAHDRGIVHRDLKPANVLLAADGTPKIADFGLAKRLEDAGQTQTGTVMGTPSYMAPEQARGRSNAVGPSSDIYALGAILYELVTGRPPFRAETPLETLAQVVGEEPIPPSRLNPRVSRDLETVCLKCLQKEPRQRYASAEELADDLERFQSGAPVRARPVGSVGRFWRWCRRNRALAAAGTLAAMALLAVALISSLLAVQQSRSADKLAALADEKERMRQQTAASLFRSLVGQARAVRLSGKLGYRKDVWKLLREAVTLDFADKDLTPVRDELLACLGDPIGVGAVVPANITPIAEPSPDLSPELEAAVQEARATRRPLAVTPDALAVSAPGGYSVILRGKSGPQRRYSQLPVGVINALRFSPDGKQLAAACAAGLIIWDVADSTDQSRPGPKLLRRGFFRGDTLNHVVFDGAGHLLATVSQVGQVNLWSLQSHGRLATLKLPGPVARLAFSTDGKHLVGIGNEGNAVYAWRVRGTPEKMELAGHEKNVTGVAFSPDGTLLVSVSQDQTVRLWSAKTGALLHTCHGHRREIQAVAFNPDGRLLVTGDHSGVVFLWDARSGQNLAELDAKTANVWRLSFAPNGVFFAVVGDKGLTAWSVRPGTDPVIGEQLISANVPGAIDLAIHPAGSEFACLDRQGKLWVSSLREPDPRPLGHHGRTMLLSLDFDPTGERLRFLDGSGHVAALDWLTRQVVATKIHADHGHFIISQDQRCAVTQNVSRQFTVHDLKTQQPLLTLPPDARIPWDCALNQDNTSLALAYADGRLAIWNLPEVWHRLDEFGIPTRSRPFDGN